MRTAIICLMLSAVPAAAVMSPKEFETEAKKWVEEAKAAAGLDCAAMHDVWYAGCATPTSALASSALPMIAWRMLLKSWAMPPAKVPMASIF